MLAAFRHIIAENAKALYVINNKRYAEFQDAFLSLKKLLLENDPDVNVNCEFNEDFKDIGYIVVTSEGIDIMTHQMPEFRRIFNLADNVCFYPSPEGKLQIELSLTFHDVMTKIEK